MLDFSECHGELPEGEKSLRHFQILTRFQHQQFVDLLAAENNVDLKHNAPAIGKPAHILNEI